jgi:PPIC-type PPIASE domain
MISSREESKWPNSSACKTKAHRAGLLAHVGVLRRVLFSVTLALCAVPALPQTPAPDGAAPIPGTRDPSRRAAQRPTSAAKLPPRLGEVPADATVVTLKGVCKRDQKAENPDCKTVITRAEMDRIVALLAPSAPHASPQQIVISYVRLLAAATLAEERKLENNPTVAKELEGQERIARLQVLAKAFYKQIAEGDAVNPTTAEIQKYYADHPLEFEEGEVWRLSIPKPSGSRGSMSGDPAIVKALMDGLQRQAVAGYDFDQIQLQAYKDLGINRVPPPTRLTGVRRSSLIAEQAAVFDLQPGEVSPVIETYTNLVILKLVSKQGAPIDSVVPEIRSDLKPALLQREIQSASKNVSAEFDLTYLAMSAQPVLFPIGGNTLTFSQSATSVDARRRASSHPHTPPSGPTSLPPQSNP